MYCTTVYLEKRIFYCCLFFILSMGLLLQFLIPLQGQERWNETLLLQTGSRGWVRRARSRRWVRRRGRCRQGVKYLGFLKRRGKVVLCRLGFIAILLMWHGWPQRQPLAWGLLSLPLADAVLAFLPLLWPGVLKVRVYFYLTRGVQELYRLTVVVLGCAGLFRFLSFPQHAHWALLAGGGVRTADGAWARGEIEEDGTWHLEIKGHITITWKPRNFFEERILLILFRQVRTPQSTPKRPLLRQEWLAEWFGTKQEWISRWQKYVRQGGLEKLNGEHTNWVVTPEIRQAILDIWVPDFWLGADQVRQRLLAAGRISSLKDISEPSIHRVAQEAGFAEVRRLLRQMFKFSTDGPQWRDGVLIARLFELNERLMAQLQEGGGLTPQVRLEIESLRQGLGVPTTSPTKPLPYAHHLQQALFGQAEEIDTADDQPASSIRCPHCGSALVRQKENTPRRKKYRDPETGAWREAEGYRCYCHNPDCALQTFTNYPDGVRLYSSWTVDTVIWGVMVYMRMRTTYRLAAEAVGVSHVTLWRWAMAVGEHALPVAALFGAVRSSGVVGLDEKWVLVPKNDKPPGKRKRWMYVYMAVDVFTYDLLHIDIYPYNGKREAHAFLQALKAKGYCPQVIVTDLCQDYDGPVRLVFPGAVHHECVFHALQWAQRLVKDVYGNNYAETHLEALTLKDEIYRVFKAKSKKTLNKRYREVMALRAQYVAHMPESQRIFDFLERHYPKLVNAVENPLIPLTNNTVELVNRRFAQHYQNMCGFDGIETARNYLHLFELTYRFTPFAKDNRPVEGRELDIRGKCPLELAGYDISHIPIARVVRGQLLGWPPRTLQGLVPSM